MKETKGLQLQKLQQEPVYYLEAANGMTVRVPESKRAAWEAEQDRQRRGIGLELTPQEKRFAEQILARIYRK